jgi:hypothetical protein
MAAARMLARRAGWVLVRPLRPPRAGNQHATPDKPTATGPPSPASMIFRRWPASSSFVLAAARLRALQRDPWPRDEKTRAPARKDPEEQPARPGRHDAATGPDPYALLTVVALMGADVSNCACGSLSYR